MLSRAVCHTRINALPYSRAGDRFYSLLSTGDPPDSPGIRKPTMDGQARQALFISHANPEDNAFTLWLGAKLTALGYQVFADILRLRGGDD
jgi:hypothetical protein